jgi:hypothetical protein
LVEVLVREVVEAALCPVVDVGAEAEISAG